VRVFNLVSDEVERLTTLFDTDVRDRIEAPDDETQALVAYQSLDRGYELVNQVLRREVALGELDPAEANTVEAVVEGLTRLVRRWSVPEPARAYRGLRSRDAIDLASLYVAEAFVSTSLEREVAIEEFTLPPGESGAALLELEVPAGVAAIWAPPLGDPALAYQAELILDRGVRIIPRPQRTEAGILVVDCEVQT